MTALDRYLAREILLPFAAGLLLLTQALLAGQVLAQADLLLGPGASAGALAAVALDLVPHLLGYVLPVAFLLGAVTGVARLAGDRELAALAAAGIGPARLVRAPLALGAAVAAVALWNGLALEPAGLRDARRRAAGLARDNLAGGVSAGVLDRVLPGVMLYAAEASGGQLGGVVVAADGPGEPTVLVAREGRLEPGGDGELELVLRDGEAHQPAGRAGPLVARFRRATLTLGVADAVAARNRLAGSPFELGAGEIVARARGAADPAEARRWWTFLHRRVAGPLAALAFALAAVPLAAPLAGRRGGGRALAWAGALGTALAYYVLLRAGEGLAARGAVPPWLGPHLPNLAVAAAGLAGLARLSRARRPGPGAGR